MLHTVGHSAHPATRFAELLLAVGVDVIVDVRRHPGSRRNPQFNRGELERWLPLHGLEYRLEGDRLGGQRGEPTDSEHHALPAALAGYACHMATRGFSEALDDLESLARDGHLAVMCAEADPRHCHRWLLSDALVVLRGLDVAHIGPKGGTASHRPSPSARVADGRLIYDVAVDRPLPFT